MKLIKGMFPDIIMKMQEGSNMMISLLLKIPQLKEHMPKEPYAGGKDNILKIILEILSLIGCLMYEFFKKLAYVFIITWIPWRVLGNLCPYIARQHNLTIIYIYFILSTVCGTITNTTIFTMSGRDSFLLNTAGIKSSVYYFGRIIYRMLTDLFFGAAALAIVGLSGGQAFLLAAVTSLARPVGEVAGLVIYSFFKKIHSKKAIYDGVIIALAIITAYAFPYSFKKISPVWSNVTGPVAVAVTAVLSVMSLYVIWNYKRYGSIVRNLIFTKREDFN